MVGVPDDDLGERIVAHVVRRGGAADGARARPTTSRPCSPRTSGRAQVRFTDALPRNDMGKVVKARLPKE